MKIFLTFLLLLLAVSSGWAEDHSRHQASPPSQSGGEYGAYTKQMNTDMEKMMRDMHAPGYSGDPDIDFLAMMIPHHQGAVDMARLELIYGKDPLVRKLAEDIIASQRVEIDAMTHRLGFLRSMRGAENREFPALGGTRGRGREGSEEERPKPPVRE